MNIHEYQAKELLSKYGIAVPRGGIADTPNDAGAVAEALGGDIWVVKSQIHAGGRGAGSFANEPNGGGIRLAHNINEVNQSIKIFKTLNFK